MQTFNRQNHWENIYNTKSFEEVSWYQKIPQVSLDLFSELDVPTAASIMDAGGGDNFLVDYLLELGYENLTVLDISQAAIARAKNRLGDLAQSVNWLVNDVVDFQPTKQYDVWHDRAAFHFLTDEKDVQRYIKIVADALQPNGYLFIGTFSENGPTKCSGIDIRQYSEAALKSTFEPYFHCLKCFQHDHPTPSEKIQNFQFCIFKKK